MHATRTLCTALAAALLLATIPAPANAPGAPLQARVPSVPIVTALTEEADEVRSFVGRVIPKKTVDMAFQVSGQMIDLPPREGERIAQGGVIARLDPEGYRLELRHAEAVLGLARAEHDRILALSERDVAPSAHLDRARAELSKAEVAVDAAARALSQTAMAAPFDALVARRLAEEWSNITPAVPVLRLQDVSTLLVTISLPEAVATRVRTSPEAFSAVARFPALDGLIVPLDLDRFVTDADAFAQTYEVKLALQSADPRLLPGMTATVDIRLRRPVGPVLVPSSAIDMGSSSAPRVWVLDAENRARPRSVDVGLPRGGMTELRAGIEPGERIVASGWRVLRDGLRVHAEGDGPGSH